MHYSAIGSALGAAAVLLAAVRVEEPSKTVRVLMRTEKGDLTIELDAARAPITTANFVKYVNGRFYDGGVFHRTVTPTNQPNNKVRIDVIQGGVNPAREKESLPPIPLERTNKTGLTHQDGTISMARDGPDTATSDFFICIGAQASLDYGGERNSDGQGFGAFGRVVEGMDVVRAIQAAAADGQKLTPPIKILSARRLP
jgi:peptidyl-prolyl cis-trans isomerase A (cyclophilin A)